MSQSSRRGFIRGAVGSVLVSSFVGDMIMAQEGKEPLFRLSLAEWSLHRELFANKISNLDFPGIAKQMGFEGVEYVNQFFKDKARDQGYLDELQKRAKDAGVRNVLIMCDGEGNLGDPDAAKRATAVQNHHKWVDAAKFLGCHSIRVNAASAGTYDEQIKLAADGLAKLTEYGGANGLNVIVENHGGLSSNGQWLAAVIKRVDNPRCGTLPDFGNFRIREGEEYDRYKGVTELMPFARGVSAKSHDFNEQGEEIHTDFRKMMKIVMDAGYHGFVGVEYEGSKTPEREGIELTRKLLLKVRDEMKA